VVAEVEVAQVEDTAAALAMRNQLSLDLPGIDVPNRDLLGNELERAV
jgi:hypothetical protein